MDKVKTGTGISLPVPVLDGHALASAGKILIR
jgi:hypothetical protein